MKIAVTGKGGVGKTTCATAAALRYARRSPQGSFLLVSTDPAHSLADSIGDLHLPDNIKILEFNAQDSLETFKTRHRGKFAEIAARGTFLDEQDIRRVLDLSLPGLDELMALLAIAGWAETRVYDLIVVDTAPTGHTLRLLTTPELIRPWLKALDALLSIAQMPGGVPVGCMGIGKAGAKNAAYLAARILALSDAAIARRLAEVVAADRQAVLAAKLSEEPK